MEIKNPANTPTSKPTTSAAIIPTMIGIPLSTTKRADTAPERATTEPTPRSTLPVNTQNNIPVARITT